ncbi:MAG: phosphatidylserine/phosphatidylglycerophosphate/cardiolipin synthase family protein [Bdellovibrio sp.]|nr:phosphatidylserine/phosphatidylglycerophosphate/cardiolipin synthase family protein [Bdellovibrio sp.]
MTPSKPSKTFAAIALTLSLLPMAHAQTQTDLLLQQSKGYLQQKMSQKEQLAMKLQAIQYLTSILSVNPLSIAESKQLDPMSVNDLSQLETTDQEMKILNIWAQMIDNNTLRSNIEKLIEEIKTSPTPLAKTVNALTQAQQDYAISTLSSSIEGVVKMRGLTNDSMSASYREWIKLSKKMVKQVDDSKAGEPLDLADTKWIRTESAEVLVNGPASFEKRDLFMSQSQKSINILTWSIYDDVTGSALADLLIAKKKENPNLKIRVIVDGQVAASSGHDVQVMRLDMAGIEVIRWISGDISYIGQHRKMMIVDDQHMIAGGLNFGDVYSHKNPDLSVQRWRDTDVYVKGAGAEEGNRLFAKIWNEQLSVHRKLKYDKMKVADADKNASSNAGPEIALINSNPMESKNGSTVMLTILKAIREAKQIIDIENAYIILFPGLKQEIQAAITRGVQVRIFTNSSESVDEPVVSIPILRSVSEFVAMGAKVYVKKGATLHSKFVVVDSDLSLIMSYNLHPRSERVEGEMAVAIRDVAFASNMHKVFDQDVTADKALEVKSAADLKMPNSPVSVPTLRLFFDML